MKTITPKLIITGLLMITLFTSCSKEDDIIADKTMLLVQKDWKFEGYGLDENNNGIIETSENSMQPCEVDDVFTFHPDCTGVYARGIMPCSENEPLVINFDWRLMDHGTQIAIFAAPELINRLDENILEIYYMDENLQGQPVKYIRRFRH